MNHEHPAIGLTATLYKDVVFSEFEREGQPVEVANFTLVRRYGEDKEYTSCSAYGEKAAQTRDYRPGDRIHVFGYWKERTKNGKTFKNFIVLSHRKENEEN